MEAKKTTLNELRSLVRSIIKEYHEESYYYYAIKQKGDKETGYSYERKILDSNQIDEYISKGWMVFGPFNEYDAKALVANEEKFPISKIAFYLIGNDFQINKKI